MKEKLRRLCDDLRGWLVAPINDDLRLNRGVLMEVLAHTLEVKTKMITKEQVEAFIEQLTQNVEKVGADVIAYVGELRDQIAAGQSLDSTLAKLESLGAKLQTVDDLIPERPATATATPNEEVAAGAKEAAPAGEGNTAPLAEPGSESSGA